MKKLPFREPRDPIKQTHLAEDQSNYQNYHPSDSHKTTDPREDFPEEEDSPEEEDFPEEEDSPEEEGIQVEEECHLGDHQEEVGDHHQCPCNKPLKGSWWENLPQSTMVTERRRPCSSTNGSYIGQSTTTTPS